MSAWGLFCENLTFPRCLTCLPCCCWAAGAGAVALAWLCQQGLFLTSSQVMKWGAEPRQAVTLVMQGLPDDSRSPHAGELWPSPECLWQRDEWTLLGRLLILHFRGTCSKITFNPSGETLAKRPSCGDGKSFSSSVLAFIWKMLCKHTRASGSSCRQLAFFCVFSSPSLETEVGTQLTFLWPCPSVPELLTHRKVLKSQILLLEITS